MRSAYLGGPAVFTAACLSIQASSTAVDTAAVSAQMTVTADATGTAVAGASLTSASNPTQFIELAHGDAFTASTGGHSQAMVKTPFEGAVSYVASFAGAGAADTAFTIALQRATGSSAPSSVCTLPPPFDVSLATTSTSFSRKNDTISFVISSPDPNDAMSVAVSGNCIQPQIFYIGNGPMPALVAGGIQPAPGGPADASCPVTLAVQRSRQGTLDPAFASGGKITCSQTRAISITSTQ